MTLEEKTELLKKRCDPFRLKFPTDLITEFVEYWTEPNKSGTKQRWELEKTWDTGRRLTRWANNNFQTKRPTVKGFQTEAMKEPVTEIEKLDAVLMAYKKHPTSVDFNQLSKHYELMKNQKLLKKFTVQEVQHIQTTYKNDNEKCRSACVVETFKTYCNHGLSFSDLLNLRNKK